MFELAKKIAKNIADEGEAVEGYTEQLKIIDEIDELDEETKSVIYEIRAITEEITADELNHITLLHQCYEKLSGITAKKE